MTFSPKFLHADTFLHLLHLDLLRRHIEIETESKNFVMYGYIAEPPMAIPIYTVLPYCVISATLVVHGQQSVSSIAQNNALCAIYYYQLLHGYCSHKRVPQINTV